MQRLKLVSPKADHEEVFMQRYDRLLEQALHITDRSYSAAQDLVHDAFIQFTLSQPDLASIKDLDSYLFIVLRNMHVSQVRRASQVRFAPISIADYDSAAIGLRALDIQKHIQVTEELFRICDYTCLRKESSKAASVLILRFFHGYYTSEISDVIRSTRRTVHEWLRIGRNEVKAFLDNPNALTSISERIENKSITVTRHMTESELLSELRERIFASRRNACPTQKALQDLYSEGEGKALECKVLAHIVSCPDCLDALNRMQRIPPLSDRHPNDMLGPDTRSHEGGNEMNRVTHAERSGLDPLKLCRRRLGEVLDHQPQALSFSANGFILGSQKVNSEITEQILSINIDEEINFVEVFSEQGVRLMFMGVKPCASGGVEQKARLKLDDQRDVECVISFNTPWPTLHVTYRDLSPRFDNTVIHDEPEPFNEKSVLPRDSAWLSAPSASGGLLKSVRQTLMSLGFWSRPTVLTAVSVVMLVAILAIWFSRPSPPPPTMSAADLLQRARASEENIARENGTVTHRTINLEEATTSGAVIARKTIEIWQSPDRGIMVRRLYDEKGNLIAGDWRRADGVQTLYQHGHAPRIQLAPGKRVDAPLNFEEVWQLSPSAGEFSSLVDTAQVKVEEGPTAVRLTYEIADGKPNGLRLFNASLTLNRSDLHATGQTLLVQMGSELRQFRFQEASFQKRTLASVPTSVFEPEATLLNEKPKEISAAQNTVGPEPVTHPPVTVVATPALEIEVLQLLNDVGADTGEQIFVRRTASGVLQVDGVVDNEERKKEILQALADASNNPALKINVETIQERVAREAATRTTNESIAVEKVEPTSNSIPLEPELRLYFTARGVPFDQVDAEVQRFSRTVMGQSSQILQHAGSLMNLTGRFSSEELRSLDPSTRAKWLSLIHKHAQALRQNVVSLRRGLGPTLGQAADEVTAGEAISDDAALLQAVSRLFSLASAIDVTVRSSLSLSTHTSQASRIKGPQFWRSLVTAEDVATRLMLTK